MKINTCTFLSLSPIILIRKVRYIMTRQLRIIEVDGERFYVDTRLEEIRLVSNPHYRLSFDSIDMDNMELAQKVEQVLLQEAHKKNK